MPDGLSIDVEEEVPADLASALSPFQKPQNSFINSLVPIDKNVPPSMSLLSYICTNMKANDTLFELYSPYIGKYIIQTLTEHKKKGFNNVDNYQETLKVWRSIAVWCVGGDTVLHLHPLHFDQAQPDVVGGHWFGFDVLSCSLRVVPHPLPVQLCSHLSPSFHLLCRVLQGRSNNSPEQLYSVPNHPIQEGVSMTMISVIHSIALYIKNDLKSAYKTPVIALYVVSEERFICRLEKLVFKINNSLYEAFDSISDNLSYTNFIIKLFKASNKSIGWSLPPMS